MSKKVSKLKREASKIQSRLSKSGEIKKGSPAAEAQSIADKARLINKKNASLLQSQVARKSDGKISKDSIVAKYQSLADS